MIRRWTATGASYQFVLFPIVSVIGGALLLGEDVTSSLLLGRRSCSSASTWVRSPAGPSRPAARPWTPVAPVRPPAESPRDLG